MKSYVITDEFVVLHIVEHSEDDVVACNEKYSIIDEKSLQALIDAGLSVVVPSEENGDIGYITDNN